MPPCPTQIEMPLLPSIFLEQLTKSLEKGGQIDIIYTDFEKAFDKVPHLRLLSKLRSYGVNEKLLAWIEEFLFKRKFCVKVNGNLSKWIPVTSGIPQGSVLGSLLFFFVNDLPNICGNLCDLFLFADDAKMYKYILEAIHAIALQECFKELCDWSDRWLMKLNK